MTAACTSLLGSRNEPVVASRAAEPARPQRIAQLAFGREARFAVCVEPACPKITPKTLAVASIDAAAAVDRTVALQAAAPPPPSREERPVTPSPDPEPREERVTVHFVFGSATLTDDGRRALRAAMPLARSSDRIVINGRTDSVGADAANQQLAFARALAVREFIRTQAPDLPHVIAINARGNCCFVADNATVEGRQKNRRVEVVFNLKV
jgi:outer membrane protein OmpA-like peptidoglycan-associated protein